MTFRRVTSAEPVVDYLADVLKSKLQAGQRVLWFLSGGSAVELEVAVALQLKGQKLDKLVISLADERFGPVGHSESIWQQLLDGGFDVGTAELLPVLNGLGFTESQAAWGAKIKTLLEAVDYRLAFLGIGPDGHIAGILPNSPATKQSSALTFAYQSEAIPGVRPAFQRITLTPAAIARLDEVVVYAMGDAKKQALEDLQQERPASGQPAQLLKRVSKVTIFTDQMGDTQ